MPKSYLRWSAVVIYCGLIFYLSSLPSEDVPLPPMLLSADKILHALEYGLLSILITWALGFEKRKGALIAVVLASLYGLTDEFHQSFISGREFSAGDWLADTAGAVLVQLWRIGIKF